MCLKTKASLKRNPKNHFHFINKTCSFIRQGLSLKLESCFCVCIKKMIIYIFSNNVLYKRTYKQ